MPSHSSAYGKKGMKGNNPMKRKDKKPDFLDLDKDGNKKEPMKQAARQAKGKMPNMKISAANEKKLMAHAEHHSKKHMDMMRKLMREGKSFDEAHRAAQKSVGK